MGKWEILIRLEEERDILVRDLENLRNYIIESDDLSSTEKRELLVKYERYVLDLERKNLEYSKIRNEPIVQTESIIRRIFQR